MVENHRKSIIQDFELIYILSGQKLIKNAKMSKFTTLPDLIQRYAQAVITRARPFLSADAVV